MADRTYHVTIIINTHDGDVVSSYISKIVEEVQVTSIEQKKITEQITLKSIEKEIKG